MANLFENSAGGDGNVSINWFRMPDALFVDGCAKSIWFLKKNLQMQILIYQHFVAMSALLVVENNFTWAYIVGSCFTFGVRCLPKVDV